MLIEGKHTESTHFENNHPRMSGYRWLCRLVLILKVKTRIIPGRLWHHNARTITTLFNYYVICTSPSVVPDVVTFEV